MSTIDVILSPPCRKPFVSKKTKAFLLASAGTVLEYYDYALYGFFAPVFAQDFFPQTDPTVALLQIFAIFFVGSMAKPVGSILFGILGDRWGADRALSLSIIGMALATLSIGILPGYAAWGSYAAFGLVLCRFVQGMSVIGESDSMQVFIYEQFGHQRSCFMNSLCCMAWKIGISMGSVAYALVMQQSEPLAYYRWPFIVGGILGLVIVWQRQVFLEDRLEAHRPTILSAAQAIASMGAMYRVILGNKRLFMAALCLCGACGGSYHFYFSFLNHYQAQWPDRWVGPSPMILPAWLCLYTLSSLLGALIADRIGVMPLMRLAGYALLLLSLLQVCAIMHGALPLILMGTTVVGMGIFQAPAFVSLLARAAVHTRCRIIFFGHAMGALLFSGSTPAISLWLWHKTQWIAAPFVYFVFLVLLGIIGVCLLAHERYRQPINQSLRHKPMFTNL